VNKNYVIVLFMIRNITNVEILRYISESSIMRSIEESCL